MLPMNTKKAGMFNKYMIIIIVIIVFVILFVMSLSGTLKTMFQI